MKYYGELTKRLYDTSEACEQAETAAKEKERLEKERKEHEMALAKEKKEQEMAVRKEDAAKVEAARKAMIEAQNAYRKALEAFCAKYGAYHWTSKSIRDIPTLFDFWNFFS